MPAIHHIALNCHDIHEQEKFFSKHFGFKRVWTFNEGEAGEFLMLRSGSCCLELFSTPAATPKETRGGEQAIGLKHLAFSVDKIETTLEALKAEGIESTTGIIDKTPVPELRITFFNDHEGNTIELMENWPASA
jgi:glyoxylase I family protein